MLELARENFPDRTFADLDASEPQEGVANLDDAIAEMLQNYATRQAEDDEKNSKLKSLLGTDPDIADVIQSWIETGDPRVAIVDRFGDDLGMSEEARERFKDNLDGWRERKAANDALDAEANANWQESLEKLVAWGEANGIGFDQQRDVMLRLLAVTFNGMENKYGEDDFNMALHSMNYDTDVAAARAAGEVAGRNARIAAERRVRSEAGVMPPAGAAGQGGRATERKPEGKSSPWANVK